MSKAKKETEFSSFTLVLVVLIALVNGLDLFVGNSLVGFSLGEIIEKKNWTELALFPFRIASGWLSLLIFLYFFWVFGSQLELEMQTRAYFFYVLCGYFFILLGTLFYPLNASYLSFSIFLAIAFREPDMEILFLFLIPMKLKWLAGIGFGFLFLNALSAAYVQQSFSPFAGILLSFSNFFLFHAKDIARYFTDRSRSKKG